MSTGRRYAAGAAAIAAVAVAIRIAYVFAQPSYDPWFTAPALDGGLYLQSAMELLAGSGLPDGAFYRAPGYAWILAAMIAAAGESFTVLYILQQLSAVAAGFLLGETVRRSYGEAGGLWTFALAMGYQPLLFFSSRTLGEVHAILFLAAAMLLLAGHGGRRHGVAGLLAGAAVLVRPNFLLVPAVLVAMLWAGRKWKSGLLLAAGTAVVLLPVTVRNYRLSGHLVPVSSNAGMTLYHGNGAGALGVFTPPEGFSGRVELQQEEATALARARSGDADLDAVEADRWWGRQALKARAAAPAETLELLGRRLVLTLANQELGLDDHPGLDSNPWRRLAPVPFGVLLALAVAGWLGAGPARCGGRPWLAVLAVLAVTPVLFYVSSRYRLPMAVFMTVPAGVGAAELCSRNRRIGLAGAALAVLLASLLMPDFGLGRSVRAGALANRALAWKSTGNLQRALADGAEAVRLDPELAPAWFRYGTVLEAGGELQPAAAAYRNSLVLDPGSADAAGNLGGILIRSGAPERAIPWLESALAAQPAHRACRMNLIVALGSMGNFAAAREQAREAMRHGIRPDPALLASIGWDPAAEDE